MLIIKFEAIVESYNPKNQEILLEKAFVIIEEEDGQLRLVRIEPIETITPTNETL